ncbi:MAG: hypothetical protein HQL78_07075 [Magnetococcales bacterium]|nr:hypothetical protein [Magnetococcales bacterium]
MLTIYFCFPYRGVGGVSLLFLRLAEYLEQSGLAQCHLVDYVDGFMARHIQEPGVRLEVYEDVGSVVPIPSDAIALFQSMTPWSIFPGIQPDPSTRVLFWNCYPFNLIPLFPGLRRQMQNSETFGRLILSTLLRGYCSKIRRLVDLLLVKQSLVFMDGTNLETTERYLGLTITDPIYVPIPIIASTDKRLMSIERDYFRHGLRVVWVGRIVDFKFYTFHRCLIELDRLQPVFGMKIGVTVVGTGEYRQRLSDESAKLSNLQFEFIDYVAPQDLDDFLICNADLLVAMGTSALEGARLGIPTLLLDVAHAPVSADYIFTWLYERKNFSLGDIVCRRHFSRGNNSLGDRLREIINRFPDVSSNTRSYVYRQHELSGIAEKLITALNCSRCTYQDLKDADLLGRGFIYSLFAKVRKKMVSA